MQPWCYFKEGSLVLHCHIQTNASANQIVGLYNERIKIKLNAPAVDGKANKALVKFLADELDIAQSAITIQKGEHDNKKVLHIIGLAVLPAVIRQLHVNPNSGEA